LKAFEKLVNEVRVNFDRLVSTVAIMVPEENDELLVTGATIGLMR
jgi:hypothetical protein